MTDFTNYLGAAIINQFFRGSSQTTTTPYIALFSVMPNAAGAGATEVTTAVRTSGRVTANFSAPATGVNSSSNAAIVDFGNSAGNATVLGFGLFDAASAGNLLAYKLFSSSVTVQTGNTVQFPAGSLVITGN